MYPPAHTHDLSQRTDAHTWVNNGDVINRDSVLKEAHSASCTLLWRKQGWPILVFGSTATQDPTEQGCFPTNNSTRNCTSLKMFLTHFCAKSMIPPHHELRPRHRAHAWRGAAAGQGPPSWRVAALPIMEGSRAAADPPPPLGTTARAGHDLCLPLAVGRVPLAAAAPGGTVGPSGSPPGRQA
jgi:hypothetical protein